MALDLSVSDEQLVGEAREGNREAFSALLGRYQVLAVVIAHGILRNWELAKDSSQNAFVKAYLGLKSFRGDSKFKTWFVRIVLNEAKDALRREKSKGSFRNVSADAKEEGQDSFLELIPEPGESPRQVLEALETKKRLERAIFELPERQREVFILRYFQELSLEEVSQALNIAVGTVKAHLSQGTEKLKEIFQKGGVAHGTR